MCRCVVLPLADLFWTISPVQTLEENGGPDALKQIKSKVPTYTTVFI